MLGKFEKKILDLKKKIDPRWAVVFSFMIFSAAVFVAFEMGNNFKRQKTKVEDQYNKEMYDMVGYVQNVSNQLAKLEVSSTNEFLCVSLANIWKQSNLAKTNLESLPIEEASMAGSSKFLAQVSDYSYTLMKKVVSGESLSDSEYSNISKIYNETKRLSEVMNEVYSDLNDGKIHWDELSKEGNEKLKNANVESSLSVLKIGKTFQEYEGLIYDGAFSDHMMHLEAKSIESESEITIEEAENILREKYIQKEIEEITDVYESNGKIDLYNFNVKIFGKDYYKSVSVTKKGGKLYSIISNRNITDKKLSMDEAKQKGIEYLKSIGIENMRDSYYLTMDNFAIINYCATQDEVLLYPDLIKIKIALDSGEVLSYEAGGYIFNHVERKNLNPKISLEEAKSILNKNINVISSNLAVIPTESNSEIFTYEFKGKVEEKEFLVYVNASERKEERILIVLDTPGGILTM